MRAGTGPSLESGARLDNRRPLESVDGLMKIELERKEGWRRNWAKSLSKLYCDAKPPLGTSKTYPNGDEGLKSEEADWGPDWFVGVFLELSDSGDKGPERIIGVPSWLPDGGEGVSSPTS